jgi:hypothetical protein
MGPSPTAAQGKPWAPAYKEREEGLQEDLSIQPQFSHTRAPVTAEPEPANLWNVSKKWMQGRRLAIAAYSIVARGFELRSFRYLWWGRGGGW